MKKEFLWFLSDLEEQEILEAIRQAEQQTSGEIRVHLHAGGSKDIDKEAVKTFQRLGMHKTALRNGILFYIDTKHKKFAVIGDEGIHKHVKENFWQETANILEQYFTKRQYKDGLVEAILYAGNALKKYFPWQEDDVNELPDEISYD